MGFSKARCIKCAANSSFIKEANYKSKPFKQERMQKLTKSMLRRHGSELDIQGVVVLNVSNRLAINPMDQSNLIDLIDE